jgi:organic hydroperoxide reductase OsmC/OhrA
MRVVANVRNTESSHAAAVATDGASGRDLAIPAKAVGRGSSVNGGELLVLALATCYCNDLHREAARLGIGLDEVEVEASAEFDGAGLAARHIRYRARITSPGSTEAISALLDATDAVAEIHNTVRAGREVRREDWR